MKFNCKIFLSFVCILTVFSACLFAKDNMRITVKEEGEVITGFKTAALADEVKITIAYSDSYMNQSSSRVPLIFLFDTQEYQLEDLKNMFRNIKNKKDSFDFLIASVRFKNENISQEVFDNFIAEIFPFFEINYATESEPSKRLILAKNNFALLSLKSLNGAANYFLNLGMILENTTSLPEINKPFKKQSRIFCFSQKENILNLQNLFIYKSLEPLQNFFLKIEEKSSFEDFDLKYFFKENPKIKQIKPILKKEISQSEPFYLKIKTNYGDLDFFPTEIKFAPPILGYDESSGFLQILLPEPLKIKISGIFAGKKWSKKVKIAK